MLAIGQTEHRPGPPLKVLGKRGDRNLESVDRYGLGLAPGDVALEERSLARHDLLEAAMRRLELVLLESPRAHAVAGLDFVGVGDRLPGELARGGEQADCLGAQEVTAR